MYKRQTRDADANVARNRWAQDMEHKQAAALAAAQAAVVRAAMDWHEAGCPEYAFAPLFPEVAAIRAACADLKKLGG